MKWPPCMGMEYMDDSWCFIREGFGMFFCSPSQLPFGQAKDEICSSEHVRTGCVTQNSHRSSLTVTKASHKGMEYYIKTILNCRLQATDTVLF